ncbi:LuxR C-terminal-related transcriptional regulator [Aurantimonas sp. A2-1-M11]|uniref:helix-turn-helix transcriptional regulator n=1 Tax=Aurantimonas sp. A2-1-M11 TaxID=3113712 RepID=UPI002F91E223
MINLIYEAAAAETDEGWAELAAVISRQFKESTVVIDAGSISGSAQALLVPYRFDTERVRLHFEQFAHPEENIGVKSLMTGPVGSAFDMHHAIDESVWNRDPSVQGILAPQGFTQGSLLVVEREPERMSSLLLYRGDRAGAFSAKEMELLNAIAPHLKQALNVRRRLREMAERERGAHQLLLQTSTGVLVTDEDGCVLCATGQAEAALSSEEFIYASFGQLRAKSAHTEAMLYARFGRSRSLINPELEISGSGGRVLVLRDLPHAVAVSLTFRHDTRAFHVELRDARKPALDEVLREHYQLTPAEVEIALALKNGASVIQIAGQRRNTHWTIRTHIKAIFQKMHTHRQTELIALLNRLSETG